MNSRRADDGAPSAQLHSAPISTPWGILSGDDLPVSDRQIRDHILDVAAKCFAAQGITATSMAELAKRAEISRAWLYRNFASRDAIVRGLLVRESQRFTAMLLAADRPDRSTEETVTETFIYIVRRCRTDRLVQQVADQDTGPLALATVNALETYLIEQRHLAPVHARIAAETIVRLIISILTTPSAAIDFGNDEELRSFAYRVIPPLVAVE
ncbi:TetR/AcrR family transcriptional regulator [Nocardia sp. CS682]|uniref:TetR/AcrR family transcriptional regulator n=1 Tax=Nocardia sp. CS682 TaxID=1047172 RepID=UPI0010755511|nr:TetR/AcrR family transcriptional regulator [Nocardia sp. CS682]QBS45308.1 hypothetical protein DMB37_39755 [Nocardia sp. CS682]